MRREEEEDFDALNSSAWNGARRWRTDVFLRDEPPGRSTHGTGQNSGWEKGGAEARRCGSLPLEHAGRCPSEPAASGGRAKIFRASFASRFEVRGGAIESGRGAAGATKAGGGARGFDGSDRA